MQSYKRHPRCKFQLPQNFGNCRYSETRKRNVAGCKLCLSIVEAQNWASHVCNNINKSLSQHNSSKISQERLQNRLNAIQEEFRFLRAQNLQHVIKQPSKINTIDKFNSQHDILKMVYSMIKIFLGDWIKQNPIDSRLMKNQLMSKLFQQLKKIFEELTLSSHLEQPVEYIESLLPDSYHINLSKVISSQKDFYDSQKLIQRINENFESISTKNNYKKSLNYLAKQLKIQSWKKLPLQSVISKQKRLIRLKDFQVIVQKLYFSKFPLLRNICLDLLIIFYCAMRSTDLTAIEAQILNCIQNNSCILKISVHKTKKIANIIITNQLLRLLQQNNWKQFHPMIKKIMRNAVYVFGFQFYSLKNLILSLWDLLDWKKQSVAMEAAGHTNMHTTNIYTLQSKLKKRQQLSVYLQFSSLPYFTEDQDFSRIASKFILQNNMAEFYEINYDCQTRILKFMSTNRFKQKKINKKDSLQNLKAVNIQQELEQEQKSQMNLSKNSNESSERRAIKRKKLAKIFHIQDE